jgi:hypothetical protein
VNEKLLRREQPAYRVSAYLGFGALFVAAGIVFDIPPGWILLAYAALGGAETTVTTVRMVRRVRSRS